MPTKKLTLAKKSSSPGRVLSLTELLDNSDLTPIEIPELPDADGTPGIVYRRPLTAGVVMDFAKSGTSEQPQDTAILTLIAKVICNEKGQLLFPKEEDALKLRDARMDVFTRIATAVTSALAPPSPDAVKTLSEADTSASHTN